MNNISFKAILSGRAGLPLFFVIVVMLFAVFYLVYQNYLLGSSLYQSYLDVTTAVSSKWLSIFGVEHSLDKYADGFWRILSDMGAHIYVSDASNSSLVIALLFSTILAWPGTWIKKLLALVVGITLMFFLNCLRIALTLIVDIHFPLQFEVMSEYVLPILLVVCAILYFFVWTIFTGQHPNDHLES